MMGSARFSLHGVATNNVPMRDEYLKCLHDISERNGPIFAPLVDDACAFDENDEVVRLALEEDDAEFFSTPSHDGGRCRR